MRSAGSAVLVGLFGLQTITSRVATVISASIASRSWWSVASSGTRTPRRPGGGLEVRVDAERGPRVDELGARLEQRLAECEQHVARAVADRDPRRGHAVAVRERAAQHGVRRVGVAVQPAEDPRNGFDDLRQRRVRRLVAREHRDVLRQRVRGRRRVDGDARDALRVLDSHARDCVSRRGARRRGPRPRAACRRARRSRPCRRSRGRRRPRGRSCAAAAPCPRRRGRGCRAPSAITLPSPNSISTCPACTK